MSSPGRVTNTTAQNMHLVNPPPIAKFTRRRLVPASTRQKSAAEGARSIITFAMLLRSCGVCIINFRSPLGWGRAAENQVPLPGILGRVGKSVAAFAQNVTNLASKEEVLEEQLKSDGKVGKHFTEKFEYLVVAERGPGGVNLREYRTDENGKVVKPTGLTKGYMVTSGDFSAALCFLPILQNASSFRYLGEQDVDGRKAYVLVFAQRAGSAGPAGLLRSAGGEKSVTSVLQGIAWIDSDRYQIARLRTDQFPPASGASVWRLISDIHYHEVHFQEPASALWIPDKIVVTMSFTDRTWRDEHQYSNFKLFTVDTNVNSEQSRQPN